jgi:hypothetical protein
MKDDILQRAMFAMPLSKEAKNSGIMAGFEDDINDMDDEDEMTPMERTPQNPEIMMNTLRGDMRSTDARYMELAQMVGEEAAMETPPEVLAMLQEHFAMMQQPQGGIGGLPQGAGMMPPPMPGQEPMPMDQGAMAMPPGAMPMDQGPMMPPGGEGMAGPFPQGGAEQAPPTPDGLPPMQAAWGALITPAVRAAQIAGPRIAQGAQAANAALGRLMMNPSRIAQQYPLPRDAAGRLMSNPQLQYPTLTQGIREGLGEAARNYPRLSKIAPWLVPAGLGVYGAGYDEEPGQQTDAERAAAAAAQGEAGAPRTPQGRQVIGYEVPVMAPASGGGQGRGFISEDYYAQDPNMRSPYPEIRSPEEAEPSVFKDLPAPAGAAAKVPAGDFTLGAEVPASQPEDTAGFIKRVADEQKAAPKKSKMERIKDAYGEYQPLFESLVDASQDKKDMRTNAMLLLSDAGFKLAASKQPTMAMAIGESFAGLPRGLAAIASEAKDRGIKLKTAALQQAITDISTADREDAALRKEMVKQQGLVYRELLKQKGNKRVYVAAGLTYMEDKDGSFISNSWEIDPNDPTVKSATDSEYTLKISNPYVQDQGQAPTTVITDKDARNKKVSGMADLENALSTVDQMRSIVSNAYGPGSFFIDAYNNLLVPLGTPPAVNDQKAVDQLKQLANTLRNSIARAEQEGRLSNQDVEFVNETLAQVLDPAKFFSDPQLAASTLTALRTNLLNARHTVGSQLGIYDRRRMLSTPATGTKSDPFVIPADPDQATAMFSFLAQTLGKNLPPNQGIYVSRNGRLESVQAGDFNVFLPKEKAK